MGSVAAAAATAETTARRAAHNQEIVMCDHEGCEEAAVAKFRFPWPGQKEQAACAKHLALAQQTARNTRSKIEVIPLQSMPKELTRHERTQLIAAQLSAEAETKEIKQRNADLMVLNTKQAKELQTALVRAKEFEAQAKDAKAEAKAAREKHEEKAVALANAEQEIERLKLLVPLPEEKKPR